VVVRSDLEDLLSFRTIYAVEMDATGLVLWSAIKLMLVMIYMRHYY
jgi:hypothetical protein